MFLLGMFMVVFLVLLALTNLFLLRDPETQKPNVFYLVVVGLMALAALGLGLYLGLGYKPSEYKTYSSSADVLDAKFKSVSPELSAPPPAGSKPQCSRFPSLGLMKLTGDQAAHGRLAVLLQHGEVSAPGAPPLGPNPPLPFFPAPNPANHLPPPHFSTPY